MGSGTTLVACKQAGLQCTGIEREEKYCEIAANRLRQGVLWGAQ
jgi:site-specific DNA-methyltransferase (adenine-specific)